MGVRVAYEFDMLLERRLFVDFHFFEPEKHKEGPEYIREPDSYEGH